MTHFKFVSRANGNSVQDNEEELLKDKGVIILLEASKYYERNKENRIRYKVLKNLSSNKLALLTNGRETDIGGLFEMYIKRFESKDDPADRLLERDKKSHKESYIIPNVKNIRNLISKKGLCNLIDDEPTSWKEVEPNTNKNGHLGCIEVTGTIPDNQDEMPILIEHKLYSVSYYYENGRPVFVEVSNGWEKDPAPFYEDDDFYRSIVGEQIQSAKSMKVSPVLVSDPWKIQLIHPENENMILQHHGINMLLDVVKDIVSHDLGTNFGLTIEYTGSHSMN